MALSEGTAHRQTLFPCTFVSACRSSTLERRVGVQSLRRRWGPHPDPPRGKAPPQPSPRGGRGWRGGGGAETSDGVRRFRVISCRDAASVPSKCAGWCSVKSVTSVFKKRLGPSPALPMGEGEAGAVGGAQRLVMRVRRFRVISCRDAASVPSKCAGWCSVKSVTSVLKKRLGPSPALPVGEGEAGAVGGGRRD